MIRSLVYVLWCETSKMIEFLSQRSKWKKNFRLYLYFFVHCGCIKNISFTLSYFSRVFLSQNCITEKFCKKNLNPCSLLASCFTNVDFVGGLPDWLISSCSLIERAAGSISSMGLSETTQRVREGFMRNFALWRESCRNPCTQRWCFA